MAERRRGLGRGIGALIPNSQKEVKESPIDVFFGGNGEDRVPAKPRGRDDQRDASVKGAVGGAVETNADGKVNAEAVVLKSGDDAKVGGKKPASRKTGTKAGSSKKSTKSAASKTTGSKTAGARKTTKSAGSSQGKGADGKKLSVTAGAAEASAAAEVGAAGAPAEVAEAARVDAQLGAPGAPELTEAAVGAAGAVATETVASAGGAASAGVGDTDVAVEAPGFGDVAGGVGSTAADGAAGEAGVTAKAEAVEAAASTGPAGVDVPAEVPGVAEANGVDASAGEASSGSASGAQHVTDEQASADASPESSTDTARKDEPGVDADVLGAGSNADKVESDAADNRDAAGAEAERAEVGGLETGGIEAGGAGIGSREGGEHVAEERSAAYASSESVAFGAAEQDRSEAAGAALSAEEGTSEANGIAGEPNAADDSYLEILAKRRSSSEPFGQDGAVSFSEEVASVSVTFSEPADGYEVAKGYQSAGASEQAAAPGQAATPENAASESAVAFESGAEADAEAVPGVNSGIEYGSAPDVPVSRETAGADPGAGDDSVAASLEETPVSQAGGVGEDLTGAADQANTADQASVAEATAGAEASGQDGDRDTDDDDEGLVEVPGATFAELPLDYIIANTRQPRNVFDEDELSELAASIREVGVLQPVIVRPLDAPVPDKPQARYELIMGERRWRASQLAGEETVPAIVRRTQDEDLLRDALLENLHRTQLNALEEAAAYQQLLEDFQCTQEELSRRIARSRPQISNTLRLLKLPPLVQRRVAAGVLSAGHARALLGLSDPGAMERIAQKIVAEGLSVRQVEELVALGDETAAPAPVRRRAKRYAPELGELATRLTDRFDTRVKVEMGARRGSIKIDFASIDDLNRILGVLTPGEEGVDVDE